MGARKHLVAVNRAIGLANLDEKGLDGPMVELLRDLARRMDSAGGDGPPLNLMRSYLSATKDLARAAARKPAKPVADETSKPVEMPVEVPELRIVEESALDRIRKQKQARAS